MELFVNIAVTVFACGALMYGISYSLLRLDYLNRNDLDHSSFIPCTAESLKETFKGPKHLVVMYYVGLCCAVLSWIAVALGAILSQ